MEEQARHSEISAQPGAQETPPRRRNEKEHGHTDPEGLIQLLPVALLRSQHGLQGVLDRTAHVIQRFRQLTRGGRLDIAGQDLPDRTGEDVRVSQNKYPAGIEATNQTLL